CFSLVLCPPPRSTLFPYTTLFRSSPHPGAVIPNVVSEAACTCPIFSPQGAPRIRVYRRMTGELGRNLDESFRDQDCDWVQIRSVDRKSTRLNSSHSQISYAVFCLK